MFFLWHISVFTSIFIEYVPHTILFMKPVTIHINPVSTNKMYNYYAGKPVKSKQYRQFLKDLSNMLDYKLPYFKLPKKPAMLSIVFGFSCSLNDTDNALKTFIDGLQHHINKYTDYKFTDNLIKHINVSNVKVKNKMNEFVHFKIETLDDVYNVIQDQQGFDVDEIKSLQT